MDGPYRERSNSHDVLILRPADRVYPDWDYDVILDGLLSGKISGCPIDKADALLILRMLQKLDWVPNARQLAGAMPYFVDRLRLPDMTSLMKNLGYTCHSCRRNGYQLELREKVVEIATLKGRVWTLDKMEGSRLRFVRPNPETGTDDDCRVNPLQSYDMQVFSPSHRISEDDLKAGQTSFMADMFAGVSPELRLVSLVAVFSGLLTVLLSLSVMFLFSLVVSGQQPQVITAVLVAVGMIFLLEVVLRTIKARLLGHVASKAEYRLGTALFDKLMRLPRNMIDQAPISDQTVRLRELEGARDLFASPFATVLLELPVTVMMLVVVTALSPQLALVLVGAVVTFLIIGICLTPVITRRAADLSAARRGVTRLQMEAIIKGDVIARNGLSWPWFERAQRICAIAVRARFRLASITSLLETVSYLSVPASVTCVMFLGANKVMASELTGGELIAITMLTWRVLAPVQQGLLIVSKVKDLMRMFRQIDTMMRFPSEDSLPEIGRTVAAAETLRATNVVLSGPATHLPTLAGVSVDIPAGTLVAVCGASGSGKSALLGTLSGQIKPQAGSVWLGNNSLTELSAPVLGRHIVLVPQRAPLIYGSLAQNLRFAEPLADDLKIEAVLQEVGLKGLVSKLPRGIHNRIDPAVDKAILSGGVRTAIAVAQALLISPSVLMIDEADEDVSPAIETAIFNAVARRRGQMTTLIVTHRPSVVRAADAVLELADARARLRAIKDEKGLAV